MLDIVLTSLVTIILLSASDGVRANDIVFDFENGVPTGFTPDGAAWETEYGLFDRSSNVLSSPPLMEGERTAVSVTISIASAGAIHFDHVAKDYRDLSLSLFINGSEYPIDDLYGRWRRHTVFVDKGVHTFTWEVIADDYLYSAPAIVAIDSIRIVQPANDDAPIEVDHQLSSYYPGDEEDAGPTLERIDGQLLLGATMWPWPRNYNRSANSFSILGRLTEAGSLVTEKTPIVTYRGTRPRYFQFNNTRYASIVSPEYAPESSGDLDVIFVLIDLSNDREVARWTNHSNSSIRSHRFADITGDGELDLLVVGGGYAELINLSDGSTIWETTLPDTSWGSSRGLLLVDDFTSSPGMEVVISGQPGIMLSGLSGSVLWSYPDGFDRKLEKGDFVGDSKPEFLSMNDTNNVVVFDPEAQVSVSTHAASSSSTFQVGNFGVAEKDEILAWVSWNELSRLNAFTGEVLESYFPDSDSLGGLFGAQLDDNGDLIAGVVQSTAFEPEQAGLVNLNTGQSLGFSHAASQGLDGGLRTGLLTEDGADGRLVISGIRSRQENYRLHVLNATDLSIDRERTEELESIVPAIEGRFNADYAVFADFGGELPNGNRSLLLGVKNGRFSEYRYSIYAIDLDENVIANVIHPPELEAFGSNDPWYGYSLGNNTMLAAVGSRLYIYDVLTGNRLWQSVSLDQTITDVQLFKAGGRQKIFVGTGFIAAVVDLETRLFDFFENTPYGSRAYLNLSEERNEIYFRSYSNGWQNRIYVRNLDDFSEKGEIATLQPVSAAWPVSIGSEDLLVVSMSPGLLQVISLTSGSTRHVSRGSIPNLGGTGQPRIESRDNDSTTVLVKSTHGLHRFELRLTTDHIFSDAFAQR